MLPFNTVRTVAALAALGAAAAFSQLTAGSAAADDLEDVCGYEAPVISTTTLVLELSTVQVGQGTTAHATVTAGDETPEGTVTFAVAGMASQTVALSGGKASYVVPDDLDVGAHQVTAAADLVGCYTPSSDAVLLNVVAPTAPTEQPTVQPTEQPTEKPDDDEVVVVDDDDEVAGVARPAAPVSGILPATGVDAGLQTAAMAGFVLLAAGALALLLHRRRKVPAK